MHSEFTNIRESTANFRIAERDNSLGLNELLENIYRFFVKRGVSSSMSFTVMSTVAVEVRATDPLSTAWISNRTVGDASRSNFERILMSPLVEFKDIKWLGPSANL